ncbi:MAG: tetratricopeptide repeat protein [Blastocatellia bacterium]|nr:tetratricopeptide repeat protein [Blastocatellia bacterium]
MELFKQATILKPDYSDAYYQLSVDYFYIDKYKEALEACNKALELKPDYVVAQYQLGLIYVKLKDKEKVKQQYELLQKLDKYLAAELKKHLK